MAALTVGPLDYPMTTRFLRKSLFAGAVAICLLLLAVVVALIISRSFKRLVVHDDAFHFTFCSISSGTNHTMFSGDQLLGWANAKLGSSGLQPLTPDHMLHFGSSANATILGIGYTHDDDRALKADKPLSSTNNVTATIIGPGRHKTKLVKRIIYPMANSKGEHVFMWLLPSDLTNLAGCELRLTNTANGTFVAALRF